jgi:hypothetical protein
MRKLLPSFRTSWWQAIFLDLLVGLVLISAGVFGQSAAGSPNQIMTLANSDDGAKQLVSQTEFNYQGQLREHGMPANGAYDIKFILYSSQTGESELGSVVHEDIAVINGQFTAKLDFGRIAFDSKESWLEVAIRYGYSTDAYTSLSPRQRLTSSPYAILAQQQAWSLIGVPVGFVEGASATKTIDQYNGEQGKDEQRKDESAGEETSTSPALLGAPNFLAKFDASGNPTAQSVVYNVGNNVGIGTANPHFQLSLGSSLGNTKLALYEDGANNSYGLGVQPGSLRLHLNGSGARFAFLNSDSTNAKEIVTIQGNGRVGIGTLDPQTSLHVNGVTFTDELRAVDLRADSARIGLLVVNGCLGCSALAEPFETAGGAAIAPGMVVAIDSAGAGRLRLADKAYDHAVAGIVSGANGINPSLPIKQENTAADGSLPISLAGRVYCWADASNDPIKPGDLLTTSNTPGHAMKVADSTKAQGAIIGKALTSLTEGRGLILVLVTLR